MLERILFGSEISGTSLAMIGFTLLRMFTGVGMVTHGLGKLPPSPQFIEFVGKIGFPLPFVFGWAASLAEFGGGLLLIFGLLTRPAAASVFFTMLVAYFGVHFSDPFAKQEPALLYGFLALCFLFAGAGDYSLDALLRNKQNSKRITKK